MILQADNAILIVQVIKKAEEILENPTLTELKRNLFAAMQSPKALVLMDKKDGEIRGFLIANIENVFDERATFIKTIWYADGKFNILLEMINKVRDWTKDKGLNSVYVLSNNKDHDNFLKCKFDNAYCIMKREVNHG